jgi:hypothetical protein
MGRKIEDIACETRLSPQIFALAKAQATGNPRALEKIKLEYEIKNLTLLARYNRLDHYNNRQQLQLNPILAFRNPNVPRMSTEPNTL